MHINLDERQSSINDLEKALARRELACDNKETDLRTAEEDVRAALNRVQHKEKEIDSVRLDLDERDRKATNRLKSIETKERKIQEDHEAWLQEAQQRERQTADTLRETLRLETVEQEARLRDDIERERIAMERELKEELRAELLRRKEELSLSVSKRVALEAEEEARKKVAAAVREAKEEEERAILLRSKKQSFDVLEMKRVREDQWAKEEERFAREKEAWTKKVDAEKLEMSRLAEQQQGTLLLQCLPHYFCSNQNGCMSCVLS